MARRLRLQSGSAPLRVSVAGVDVAGASFDQIIFDANQTPLRLWQNNYASFGTSEHMPTSAVGQAIIKYGAGRPSTPSGTNPLFMVMWRCQKQAGSNDGTIQHVTAGYNGLTALPSNQQGGAGAIMGSDGLYVMDFCRRDAGYYYPLYVNYAIFRNYV